MSTKTTSKSKVRSDEARKAFSDHVAELRSRAFWIVATFIVASAVAYSFRVPLIDFIMSPLGEEKLVYLTPGGGFSFIFQVTMYAGAVVAAPLIIFHLYRFVKPALPPTARKHSFRMLVSSLLLMIGGVAFGYFVAIPSALHFLTTFAGDFVSPNLTADSYLGFVMAYLVGLGVLFQLPLFLIIWNWISPIKPGGLWNSQRFVIAFSFIAAAVITPTPDFINQSLVAGPIVGVYQFGVISVFIANRRARRAAKKSKAISQPESEPVVAVDSQPEPIPVPIAKPLMIDAVTRPAGSSLKPRAPQTASMAAKPPQPTPKSQGLAMDGMLRTRAPKPVQVPARLPITTPAPAPARPVVSRRQIVIAEAANGCVPSLVQPSVRAVGLDGFAMHR